MTSPIIADEIDEIKILKRLARDTNPQVRLRAVDLLLDLKRKAGAAADTESDIRGASTSAFMEALMPSEREALESLIKHYRQLQMQVWTRRPDLRPLGRPTPDAAIALEPPVNRLPPAAAAVPTGAESSQADEPELIQVIGSAGARLVRRDELSEAM